MSCPEDFKQNCSNMEIKCSMCTAFNLDRIALYYDPIVKDDGICYTDHPAFMTKRERNKQQALEIKNRKDKEASKRIKKALKNERKTIEYIGGQSTIGSGRVYHDGDGHISIGEILYRIEYKTRFSGRNVLGPSSTEWNKGKNQGVDIFIIKSDKEEVVTMPLKVFKEILCSLKSNLGDNT